MNHITASVKGGVGAPNSLHQIPEPTIVLFSAQLPLAPYTRVHTQTLRDTLHLHRSRRQCQPHKAGSCSPKYSAVQPQHPGYYCPAPSGSSKVFWQIDVWGFHIWLLLPGGRAALPAQSLTVFSPVVSNTFFRTTINDARGAHTLKTAMELVTVNYFTCTRNLTAASLSTVL